MSNLEAEIAYWYSNLNNIADKCHKAPYYL